MNTGQRYFGMTIAQIGILAALALFACIVIGILGTLMLNRSTSPQQTDPTSTLQPGPIFAVTSTPWPTVTPIPGWQEYSFAENQVRIWLPASYTGGDTATSSEVIMESLRATINNETFVSDIQDLLAIPEIVFFAFDTESADSIRFTYVGKEALNPDLDLPMDYYLNRMMGKFSAASDRVVERQVAQLDFYAAGKLAVESKVPSGDVETFVTRVIYLVQVDDTMWTITFRSGREEYSAYQPTIEASINSFWIQR